MAIHLTVVVHLRQNTEVIVVHHVLIVTVEVLLTIEEVVVTRLQIGKVGAHLISEETAVQCHLIETVEARPIIGAIVARR